MSEKTTTDYLDSLNGEELTAEQAAQLLELAEGDTGFDPDRSAAPATPSAANDTSEDDEAARKAGEEQQQEQQAQAAAAQSPAKPDTTDGADKANGGEAEPDPDNAVILAKDGKHTIPYDKLVQARESEREWKAKAEQAQQELDVLRAQAQARADAGEQATQADKNAEAAQAAIDAGADPGLFGDFSEEALAAGIQKLVESRVEAVMKSVDASLEPIHRQQQLTATEAHYQAIYQAHPDADSIVESKELDDWIKAQPSFAQAGYRAALEAGTTDQVIELFDAFKQATGTQVEAPAGADDKAKEAAAAAQQPDPKAAAAAAIAKAKEQVPTSLTDVPGGAAGPANASEVVAAMDPASQLEAMSGWTPEQIEAHLNRAL